MNTFMTNHDFEIYLDRMTYVGRHLVKEQSSRNLIYQIMFQDSQLCNECYQIGADNFIERITKIVHNLTDAEHKVLENYYQLGTAAMTARIIDQKLLEKYNELQEELRKSRYELAEERYNNYWGIKSFIRRNVEKYEASSNTFKYFVGISLIALIGKYLIIFTLFLIYPSS